MRVYALETGGQGTLWRGPMCDGLMAQPLFLAGDREPVGLFLLRPGNGAPRIPEPELLEVVADALFMAEELRAAS